MGKSLEGKELGKGIRQLPDRRYEARVSVGDKRPTKRFKNLTDARKWLDGMRVDSRRGNLDNFEKMTVDELFEDFTTVRSGCRKDDTLKNNRARYTKNIKPRIGAKRLRDVTQADCQLILNGMADRYSPGTIRAVRSLLLTMFKYAFVNRRMPQPILGLEMPTQKPVEGERENYLTAEEEERFREVLDESPYALHFAFILESGCRCGEVTGLRKQDIDFAAKEILIYQQGRRQGGVWATKSPKSGIERRIPMTDECARLLREALDRRERMKGVPREFEDLVFLDEKGLPPTNSAYNWSLDVLCRMAGIEKVKEEGERRKKGITIHGLRHTFASRWIRDKKSPKALQKILGHARLSTTMDLYVHISDEEVAEEMHSFRLAA